MVTYTSLSVQGFFYYILMWIMPPGTIHLLRTLSVHLEVKTVSPERRPKSSNRNQLYD